MSRKRGGGVLLRFMKINKKRFFFFFVTNRAGLSCRFYEHNLCFKYSGNIYLSKFVKAFYGQSMPMTLSCLLRYLKIEKVIKVWKFGVFLTFSISSLKSLCISCLFASFLSKKSLKLFKFGSFLLIFLYVTWHIFSYHVTLRHHFSS